MGSGLSLGTIPIQRRPFMTRSPFFASEPDRQFCNADSFAAAFDEAWRRLTHELDREGLSRPEALELVLCQLAHHPFAQKDAARAREVGEFRLRLHGLSLSP
jgi:hypothetical protein